MVAYSCMQQFVDPIRAGTKIHTMRGFRRGKSRHARVGERIQLYCHLRFPGSFKIIPDPLCSRVQSVLLRFSLGLLIHVRLADAIEQPDGTLDEVGPVQHIIAAPALDRFARADGFAGQLDLCAFWKAIHGIPENHVWQGVLIGWEPRS